MRTLLRRAYQAGTAVLPARVAAVADTLAEPFRTWSGPMNGQAGRQRLTRELLAAYRPQQVVETGTFRGATTAFLADLLHVPLYTVEAQPRYVVHARKRLSSYPQVCVEQGDSRSLLRRWASGEVTSSRRTFFYLDAHWDQDLPLWEELSIIDGAWPDAVVMVDDFAVEGDPGYAFDDYGPGRRLDAASLPSLPGWRLFYPRLPSELEGPPRRGCAVLATRVAAPSLGLPSLRPAAITDF